jgi:predicted ATPase
MCLDGIPLAIELAAARAAALGIEGLAARLDDRFRLLAGGHRTAMPRHQTLRATLDWSYELLTEPERMVLRRLAVFAGGFTLQAASAVAADGGRSIAGALAFECARRTPTTGAWGRRAGWIRASAIKESRGGLWKLWATSA